MKIDIRLKCDARMQKWFREAPEDFETATRHAVKRVSEWMSSEMRRRVAQGVGIQARIIQGRIRLTTLKTFGCVWIGLDPISARRLSPREVPGGVEIAGGVFLKNAFIVPGDGPLGGQVFVRRGKSRLPIDKVTVEIDKRGLEIVRQLSVEADRRFFAQFEKQFRKFS